MRYNGEEGHDLMGRIAKMRSTISGNTVGAAELVIGSDVIRVNVQSKTGEVLEYGADVMISAISFELWAMSYQQSAISHAQSPISIQKT